MWRLCLAIATIAGVPAQPTLPAACEAGQCLQEEPADENPALGFMQTSLHWKLRERAVADKEKIAEALRSNLTILNDAENPWVLPVVNGRCPIKHGMGVEVPFTVSTALKFKAFEWMGLIRKLRHCGFNQIKMLSDRLSQGKDAKQENDLAMKITFAWAVFVAVIIVWSVYAVASVPRKRPMDTVKMGLADDEKAYARGIMNYVSLAWVDELVGRYGKQANAVIDDNEIVCNRRDDAFVPYVTFHKHWQEEVKRAGSVEKAWITQALYKTVGFKGCLAMVVLTFLSEIAGGALSIVGLQFFLNSLESLDAWILQHPGEQPSYLAPTLATLIWIWGLPMIFRFLSIISTLVDGHWTQICASGLASTVFHKALRTPASATRPETRETADGDEEADPWGSHKPNLVQILNVDIVDCWGGLIRDVLCVFIAPFSMAFLLALMVSQISFSAIGGASYIVPVLILMMLCTQVAMNYWKKYQMYMDARLKWLTESLLSIRIVKALAWEKLALDKLVKAKDGELHSGKMMYCMSGVMQAVAHTLPWGVLAITFWILMAEHGRIAAYEVMIVQRLIQALQANISQLSNGLGRFMTVPNSFNRIRRFLAQPDRPQGVVRQPAQTQNRPAVWVMGSFNYSGTKPILKELDLAVPQGELVGIIGRVGAGKSSLLQTIIGELHPLNGAAGLGFVEAPDTATGQIAYCAQVPWIFEGTLRENIILNQQLHHDRYYKCIHAAGLTSDLQILPGGDQCTIGSFGIRLSGGQRARVALARAAYMEAAQIVLIDDPFASVDGPTGQHIFTELLLGPIMRGRTRLVVTQPDRTRLQHFDRLVLFEDGCVVETGAPGEVMETEAFNRIQQEQVHDDDDSEEEAREPTATDAAQSVMLAQQANDTGAMLLREEEVQENITWDSIWWWVKAAGVFNLIVLAGFVVMQSVIELREALVLAVWIDNKLADPEVNDGIFIRRLVIVVAACCLCIVLTFFATATVSNTAARKLHESCVESLLCAPVDRFFDKQPVGRLINRLSYDMKQVDETFVGTFMVIAQFLSGFITTQMFIFTVMPRNVCVMALPFYAATLFFIYIYRGTAVPLVFHSKHSLSSVQDLQAIVVGQCVSIRANGMLDSFMKRYNHYSQSVIRAQYLIYYVCRAWAQSRVFLSFGFLTAILALGGLWAGMSLGTLSTCVGFCFYQMGQFEGISMTFTFLLNVMNALQRLMKYVGVPAEAAYDTPNDYSVRQKVKIDRGELVCLQLKQGIIGENQPRVQVCLRGSGDVLLQSSPDGLGLNFASGVALQELAPESKALGDLRGDFRIIAVNSVRDSDERMARELCNPAAAIWLDLWNNEFEEGLKVEIEELTAGYATAKSVLHGVTLSIPPRSKCAFVGKTGCGKSTTLLCILRFLEPRSGRIVIGGRDMGRLGLRAVRSIVGLVPQDPTIFEGSIRFNLDPFDEYPDARVWEAVQGVQLMTFIRSLPDGIDTHVDRDGSNISFGQKQLISLARMVIRQPPVLLLDECTSALDPVTQEAVQKSILHDFPKTTIIAVAHRLETILDFDQICVFHQGNVIERGTVQELKEARGAFAKMLQAKKSKVKALK